MSTTAGPAPLVELDDVYKHYRVRSGLSRRTVAVQAVNGVTLSIAPGEIVGLVGESGCGKSTLSRTLVQLETIDSGQITFKGAVVEPSASESLRREIQIVFQDPYSSLPPHMTVRQIVAEPLLIHRLLRGDALKQRVGELLTSVGLGPEYAGRRPGQLSGGQRQRVGIARALALEPSLLIADEAVSALDVSVQAQILNLLRRLQRKLGLTMLFVSHDIGVVRYISDRIAVMYLGRVVELASAADVYENPAHPYTRALMDAVPSIENRNRARREIQGDPPDPKDPPPGCTFHPRCPMAQDICRNERPELREWWPGRQVACHFADQCLARSQGDAT
ncbi:ABC transporter ATP-binding protein [Pseudactinotalea sp. Z1748]|uniref:ABC transporter ATP-binding protein n=1 Tax=Pseudactinotalea sp. Z1748 TaxID=3413027 RepID=UPI003C799C72